MLDGVPSAVPIADSVGQWRELFGRQHFFDWATMIVGGVTVIAAYVIGHRAALHSFNLEQAARRDSEWKEAFNLLESICREMHRLLGRVHYIRTLVKGPASDFRNVSKAPILVYARDAMLARVVQLMPVTWNAGSILDFYENVGLIQTHQNAAVGAQRDFDSNRRTAYEYYDAAIAFANDKYDHMCGQYGTTLDHLKLFAQEHGFAVDKRLDYKESELKVDQL